ncbi:MAG TPA: transglycosylase SLT domain-containing protein [Methylomirabilota bacterium]|nr:transglycosylase SLT domain-containing protein [Methylomirabilota bacterium]
MSAVDKRRICPQIGQCTKLTIAVALTLLLGLATRIAIAADDDADLGDNPWTMCAKATNRIERQEGIPRQLLRAISKMESGRWHAGKQLLMAWPWTIMAEGQGRYLPTKEAAVAEVQALQSRGVRNIDVGCMQVNLYYHPDAFASLEDAFDPLTNVTYAASYLKSLAAENGSWAKAVAYYHSENPERYLAYRSKVREIWAQEHEKYLVALDQLRNEPDATLALATLIHVDEPLPAPEPPAVEALLHTGRVDAEPPETAPAAAEELAAGLSFERAGPVRASPFFVATE